MSKKGIIAVVIFWLMVIAIFVIGITNIDWLRYTVIGITVIMLVALISIGVYLVATYTGEY